MDKKAEEGHQPAKTYWYPNIGADIKEVGEGYNTWNPYHGILYGSVASVLVVVLSVFYRSEEIGEMYAMVVELISKESHHKDFWVILTSIIATFSGLIVTITIYLMSRATPVYLVDFTTYQPPDHLKFPHELFIKISRATGWFSEESLAFQEKLAHRTGLGNETYMPPGILASPPELNMARAREEAEMVFTGVLDQLFAQTGVKPKEIDILIVNCSLFNPTPSMSAMIINKYKMRSDVRNYNLSGMGCSAGVISIDLAKDLLQVHKNANVIVFSTENITQNWYPGADKAMLVSNTLFRLGGAAILLSNKWAMGWRSKYRLVCTVRVHKAANDTAYKAVWQAEDDKKIVGVALSKDLMTVAGDALKSNLTILGPIVLPWSEQIKFFLNFLQRKVEAYSGKQKRTPAYLPDFKKAFQHFCIHAGGRAIIDGLEENLKLTQEQVEPSRATLYRYGNTSSSSIWYELAFIELSKRINKGDKVMQIALGSGFKCNSAVWQRIRN